MRLLYEKAYLASDQRKMAGVLNDSVTVGILLTMIFGAVAFYLYSRMTQNEKRVGLLENLLLSLKMSTEASMSGADMLGPEYVEAVSSATPLNEDEVDTTMDEEKYAEMLKEMPAGTPAATAGEGREEPRKMDANYESMSLKELQALGRQKGLAVHSVKKKDLIDSLRNLETPGEPEGGDSGTQGFSVTLAEATPA
jgi:hypothetical protein